MAKVEVFKNRLTKAQEELVKALDAEKAKKKVLSEKIVQELSKLDKANVRTLNSLNKQYLDECSNNDNKINEFITELNSLNEELQSSISTYEEHYTNFNEEDALNKESERLINTARTKFKREMQDINIKIDRIEKELKETLETRNNDFEEEHTNFKNKTIEFEKRKRFEVNKIQNNTIKEYDALQKLLLQENKKSEIKSINKKIKQIRYNGLIEEKECTLKYLSEQKQFELEYAKSVYDFKCETCKLDKDINNRIEETKFDRSMIEFNFKKKSNKNETDVKHAFNESDKQYKLDYNSNVENLYKAINEKTNAKISFEKERINTETDVIKNIYFEIEGNDIKQTAKFLENNNKELSLINKDVALIQKNINYTISFYIQNIISLYTKQFKAYMAHEEEFVKFLLINDVKGAFLQGNTYEEFIKPIQDLFVAFRENEENYIQSFTDYLNNAMNNLIQQVEIFALTINQLNDNINNVINEYHNNIAKVLADAKQKGFVFADNLKTKALDEVNINENEHNNFINKKFEELAVQKEKVIAEFNNRELAVKSVEVNLEGEYATEYASLEKVKNDAISVIDAKYNNEVSALLVEYDNKVKAINIKYEEENKAIEKQYKVKIGLL